MKRVYGVVPSRRLGRSLGVSPIPLSTCTYSCVYCQLGRTKNMQYKREPFYCVTDIIEQLKPFCDREEDFDVITLVGEGEPTLYSRLGELIEAIKVLFNKKVVLITNGSLFYKKDVQDDIMNADIIMPSLDAWDEASFKKVNRPYGKIKFEEMYNGLQEFRERYLGEFYLESMCVSGITDVGDSQEKLIKKIQGLRPDKVFINTPVRPPADAWVKRCSDEFVRSFQDYFEVYADVEIPDKDIFSTRENIYEAILDIIQRHPLNRDNIKKFCLARDEDSESILKRLDTDDTIEKNEYENKLFYRIKTFRV
jgi:wyosine [tRNA(Phe)-imidazoG37] synthetase (radical SAM superfamily)